MNAEPDLARPASTVGDPRRIQMLAVLMEAGSLGTGLLSAPLRKGWLINDAADAVAKQLEVAAKGAKSFTALGIDLKSAQARRRQFACRCLDWPERRDHLGGALGAALADRLLAAHWIERKNTAGSCTPRSWAKRSWGSWV